MTAINSKHSAFKKSKINFLNIDTLQDFRKLYHHSNSACFNTHHIIYSALLHAQLATNSNYSAFKKSKNSGSKINFLNTLQDYQKLQINISTTFAICNAH